MKKVARQLRWSSSAQVRLSVPGPGCEYGASSASAQPHAAGLNAGSRRIKAPTSTALNAPAAKTAKPAVDKSKSSPMPRSR
jgi:hypothetical protein